MRNTRVPFVGGKSENSLFHRCFFGILSIYDFFVSLFGDAVIPSIEGNSALCSVPEPSHLLMV